MTRLLQGFSPVHGKEKGRVTPNALQEATKITDDRLADLLPEIFLRLPTPADLVRASATCTSFHRLITDRSVLRRFGKLHTPSILGFLDETGFYPVVPPHPSACAARGIAFTASFSFLPPPARWIVQDIRDGRVLLNRRHTGEKDHKIFNDRVVCDPLHQRYILLPPIPDNLPASPEDPICVLSDPFLAPHDKEELAAVADEKISFQVILLASCQTKPVALVFSSSTQQWRAARGHAWSDLLVHKGVLLRTSRPPMLSLRHYAYGCFSWKIEFWNVMLVLNTQGMVFSTIGLPPETIGYTIVEAGEGRLGMFNYEGNSTSDFCYSIRQSKSEDSTSNEWRLEKTISVDSRCQQYIVGATERYFLRS
uniref:F-box domain-containing protein n=1 Tax=Aegilops tauschii TaxID=37682 RepID=M8CXT0_AEGTA